MSSKAFFESYDTNDLRILLNTYSSDFNQSRRELTSLVKQYDRQDILSRYVDSERIHALITDCERIKAQYREIRDILISRGEQFGIYDRQHQEHLVNALRDGVSNLKMA